MKKQLLEESTKARWKKIAGIVNEAKKEWDEFDFSPSSGYIHFKDKGIIIKAKLDPKFPKSFTKGYVMIAWPGQFFRDTKIKPFTSNQYESDKSGVPSVEKNENGEPLFYLKNAEDIFNKKDKYIGAVSPKEKESQKNLRSIEIDKWKKETGKQFVTPSSIPPGSIN
jgi:hypothetical protein